jgi:hypothetical protein
MSSVPYVPPETMKNVAATSGHKVSLMDFFFRLEEETSEEGNFGCAVTRLVPGNFDVILHRQLSQSAEFAIAE